MDQQPTATLPGTPGEPQTERDLLVAIHDEGHDTHELARTILRMLLPKESAGDGSALEDLLATIVVQLREVLTGVRQIRRHIIEDDDVSSVPNGHQAPNGSGRA